MTKKEHTTTLTFTDKQMLVLYVMTQKYIDTFHGCECCQHDHNTPFDVMTDMISRHTVNLANYGDKPFFMLEEMASKK